MREILISSVKDHEGLCMITWENDNLIHYRVSGVTGFFRNVKSICGIYFKYGEEFHGVVTFNDKYKIYEVNTTCIRNMEF